MIDSSLSRCSSFDRLIPSFFLSFLFSLPFIPNSFPKRLSSTLSLFFVRLRRKREKEREERKKTRKRKKEESWQEEVGSKLSVRESEKKKDE